jgi:hypothetical protein
MHDCKKIRTDLSTYRWIWTETITEVRDMLNDYDIYIGRVIDRDTVDKLIDVYEKKTFKRDSV